jgi:hypothetical protein
MRANLDAHILSPQRFVAPSSGRPSSGTGQSATFRHILQQQPAFPPAQISKPSGNVMTDVNWGDSYRSLTQPSPTPAATTPTAPSTDFSNFGSTPNSSDPTGGQTYNPMANPLLTPQTSSTDINGTLVTQNSSPTVTASAAQQFAQVLGGTVVQIQTPWSTLAPVYQIELPGGQVIDATGIANILGNNAAYPSEAVKSGEIAKLMGVQYTPALANLATQLAGGANASLQPISAGVGVMSAPVLTPADGRS